MKKARSILGLLGPILLTLLLTGCMGSISASLANKLNRAILDHDDPSTVRAGAPAYMIMVDALLHEEDGDAPNPDILIAGSRLYGAYAGVFLKNGYRAKRMAKKARNMASQALCMRLPDLCGIENKSFSAFAPLLAKVEKDDLPTLFTFATAWVGMIQTNDNTLDAMAELPKVEAMMDRIVALDPEFEHGRPHLFLGVMRSQIPPAMGGKPEKGRYHFEEAIRISKGRDLLVKVKFARYYARLVFNKALHQKLLVSVTRANPKEPKLTLSNTLALQEARVLLADADDYFFD